MRRKISVYFKLEYAASDYVLDENNIETEDKIGGACSTHGKDKCIRDSGRET
jgi:hypothetical protein